jgi:hypothetical protein
MACVTACYDAAPAPRTAADVLPKDEAERAARREGPRAQEQRVDASLEHSTAAMVTALFDQAHRRDPSTAAAGSCWSTAPTTSWSASRRKPRPAP